jgi:hypothetical protein
MSSVIWMDGLGVPLGVLAPAPTFVRHHFSGVAR